MKKAVLLTILFLSSNALAAECLCVKGTDSWIDDYGQSHSVTVYRATAIVGGKEYRLEELSSRDQCLEFLKTAPECKR